MKQLLKDKEFTAVTTAEISRVAGVNEALIYRYFKDKRGLLHYILYEYLLDFLVEMKVGLKELDRALDQVRLFIRNHINIYDKNRVFAKTLLLEVRNYPGFFHSETYKLFKEYGKMLTDVIKQGVEDGDIRGDIPVTRIRDLILGGIEHYCMASVIFGREINTGTASEELCDVIFKGIEKKVE